MKKTLAFLLMLATLQAYSQKKFAVFAGVNNPILSEGIMDGSYIQFGVAPQFGVLYEMKLTEKIHFRPKLMYSAQGDRHADAVTYPLMTLTSLDYKLDYINIPMDFKFWNKIYLLVGPQVGFLINEKSTSLYQGKSKSSVDFGFNLGMGVRINDLFLEIGTYQGFVPVLEYENYGKIDLNNASARFTVGYNIF